MGVTAISPRSRALAAGDVWELAVGVDNLDGEPVDVAPVITVTLPDGSTSAPAVEFLAPGTYRASYVPAVAGRFVAVAPVAGYGTTDFAAYVDVVTPDGGMPTVATVLEYGGPQSSTPAQMQTALDAEAAAQRAVCAVGAVYPADLAEALCRRVMRNLALRRLPLATQTGDAEGGGPVPVPGRDPEVRRLEAPHRRLVVG